ncbi:MAG: 50S ribosomal protein L19 [Patescibacteria group bacterium]|jgi:large subunit ribosomal protein L19
MALYTTIKGVDVKIGDEVELVTNYVDGDKQKKQKFEGIIIAIKNSGEGKSFTVRKVTKDGFGIERVFPVLWPSLDSIRVISGNEVRRAKLYYMRGKIGKQANET